jgi:hypothetical protein
MADKYMRLPEKVLFGGDGYFSNYHIAYDFDEQEYKKKKSYFHISFMPFDTVRAKISRIRSIPAAFFAMDAKTCIDYFCISQKVKTKYVFLHHCANMKSMNLFNPDSKRDIGTVSFTDRDREILLSYIKSSFSGSSGHRYWIMLERPSIMTSIYRTPEYDGIALNFHNSFTGENDRAEGLCLFDRSERRMSVMRIAVINNPVFDPSIDPRNCNFLSPECVIQQYRDGQYG